MHTHAYIYMYVYIYIGGVAGAGEEGAIYVIIPPHIGVRSWEIRASGNGITDFGSKDSRCNSCSEAIGHAE